LINTDLRKFLKDADKGSTLFKNCKEIAYLKRPNHLITKPFIAVLILIGKCPKVKPNVNYMLKVDIDEIWFKCRAIIKAKDFLDQLQSFDIRKVNY
jgi:hypothetical protein